MGHRFVRVAMVTALMLLGGLSALDGLDDGGAPPPGPTMLGGEFAGGNGTASDPYLITNVYELQNMSLNLSAHYVLKNDINASATASWNSGAGFVPIGTSSTIFIGCLDGRDHTIEGLSINRSNIDHVGLFGFFNGSLKNIGLVNVKITGRSEVGGLLGFNYGTVNNSYAMGNVMGTDNYVGLLVGYNAGMVNNSHSRGNVDGSGSIGGLVGENDNGAILFSHASGNVTGTSGIGGLAGRAIGTVKSSYATGNVTGSEDYVGGLVGLASCTMSGSYATGNVTGGDDCTGGLVGWFRGVMSDSCATGSVTGRFDVGGLVGHNDGTVNDSYATGNVTGGLSVGGLVGNNDEGYVNNSHAAGNVTGSSQVGGLVGLNRYWVNNSYATGNLTTAKSTGVGGLVGHYVNGTLSNSYAVGNVVGTAAVGGIVGDIWAGTVDTTYFNGTISGDYHTGGIVGYWDPVNRFTISNSHYNINSTVINGGHHVTWGGLFDEQYRDWRSNDFSLNISEYASFVSSDGLFEIGDVQGLRDLLGFAEVPEYRFRLVSDIDLSDEAGLYIPFIMADFDGRNFTISNLSVDLPFADNIGMFGINLGSRLSNIKLDGKNITGYSYVGGLIGCNRGTVENSQTTEHVTGNSEFIGGLVGYNMGTVGNSSATGIVTGASRCIGGLAGVNLGTINNSYSTGNVTGKSYVGGFLGFNNNGKVWNSYARGSVSRSSESRTSLGGFVGGNKDGLIINCYSTARVKYNGATNPTDKGFAGDVTTVGNDRMAGNFWDIQASQQTSTAGNATGKNTTEMMKRCTFTNASWNFSIVWIIRESTSYPFLRWQDGGYPTANAGQDQVVGGGSEVTFDGTGSSDIGGIVNYTWTFTCGSTVTLYGVQPNYLFTVVGVHEVALNVTNKVGNWDRDTMTVTVVDLEPPRADAGPNQTVDEWTTVWFDGDGSTDNVGVVNWTWTFVDGGLVTLYGDGPSHRFYAPGIYVVTLNATDAAKNWDTDNMTVTVNDITPPMADAGPDQTVDEGTVVTFAGDGSSDNVGVANYTWTLTDDGVVVLFGARPTYQFDNPGMFDVTLNVTDAAGNRGTDTVTVTVNDITPPVAHAGVDQTVDEGDLVTFNGSASLDNVAIINFTWTFTDEKTVTLYGVHPTYRFDTPGEYVVTLRVADAAGRSVTDTMTVTVRDITVPAAHAGPDQTVDESTLVTFDGIASSDYVGIVSYTWTLMDGVPVSLHGARASHLFDNPGIFVVTLNVTDAAGNSATDALTVTVRDLTAPVADAGPDQTVDEGALVTLDGSGSTDNVGIVNYTWLISYGDETVELYGASVSFTSTVPDVYSIVLRVSDAAGHSGEDAMTLTVRDVTAPVANAGPDRVVPAGSTVSLDGSTSVDNVGIMSHSWTFTYDRQPRVLEGAVVQFTFEVGGVYEMVLNVTDGSGNRGADTVVITVVDTGRVTGTVLDEEGRPVGGAVVTVHASDLRRYTTTTAANGSFSLDIYHGTFAWSIQKDRYEAIGGNSSVGAMDERELDLSDRPLVREGEEWPASTSLLTFVALGAILVMVLTALVMVPRRKRGRKRAA